MLLTGIIAAVLVVIPRLSQHRISDVILACTVTLHNRLNQILRHISIVCQQLLGILRQTVTTITEARIVVMRTDARIQTHAVDDSLRIQPLHLNISIQLVEVAHSQSQISIGEELDSLSLLHTHEERINVLLDGTLLQQSRKSLGSLLQHFHIRYTSDSLILLSKFRAVDNLRIAHDDAARIEIIIERLALTKELRREEQVEFLHPLLGIFQIETSGIAHRDGTLDHHHRIRVHLQYQVNDLLHVRSIKVILHRVVVGRSSNHHEVCILVSRLTIQGSGQVQWFLRQIFLDVIILYRRNPIIQFLHLFRHHIHSSHLMMLSQQSGNTQSHVASTGHGNLNVLKSIHIVENNKLVKSHQTIAVI